MVTPPQPTNFNNNNAISSGPSKSTPNTDKTTAKNESTTSNETDRGYGEKLAASPNLGRDLITGSYDRQAFKKEFSSAYLAATRASREDLGDYLAELTITKILSKPEPTEYTERNEIPLYVLAKNNKDQGLILRFSLKDNEPGPREIEILNIEENTNFRINDNSFTPEIRSSVNKLFQQLLPDDNHDSDNQVIIKGNLLKDPSSK